MLYYLDVIKSYKVILYVYLLILDKIQGDLNKGPLAIKDINLFIRSYLCNNIKIL